MKCLPFLSSIVLFVGCGGGNDPASLVGQIETASKAGSKVTPDQAKRAQDAVVKLGRLGPPAIPAMIDGLGNEERSAREMLVPAFAEIGEPAVAPLTTAVAAKSSHRRRGAIDALYALSTFKQVDVSSAVPALKTAMTDADAGVRGAALATLCVVLPEEADQLLIAALKDTHAHVRRSSAQLFSVRRAVGQPAQKGPLPPELAGRNRVADLAGANRPVPPEAAPALIGALDDGDQYVRLAAAQALGKLGPAAKAAAPRIAQLLEDHGEQQGQNGFGGHEFATALVGLGPEAIRPLKSLLQSKKADVRARVRQSLKALARTHPAALEPLISGLKSPDPLDRIATAEAISELGPAGKSALPALREAERDSSELVRRAAAAAAQKLDARDDGSRTK